MQSQRATALDWFACAKSKGINGLDLNGALKLQDSSVTSFVATSPQTIDVSNNYIKLLPDSIGDIGQLERLIANDNLLRSLPTNIASLSNLRVLELQDNAIESFPNAIWNLKRLEELKLAGNKIEMVDQAARVALGLPELRSFSGSRR